MKEMPEQDRPREKLLKRGPQSLTDSELIAILLRTGIKGVSVLEVAAELTDKYRNLAVLATQQLPALRDVCGIGNDKAATLLAAFEIARRIGEQQRAIDNRKITSPEEIAKFFMARLRDRLKESFFVVCLSSSNTILHYEEISIGALDASIVDPKEVFKVALEWKAKSLILLHNHPSGNTEPSNEDIKVTKRLIEGGKILNISILDHLIITHNGYCSMAEKRLI